VSTTARWARWLTKDEAAIRARCNVRTIERAMASGEIRYSGGGQVGSSRILIHRRELDRWVLERRTETHDGGSS